MKRLYLILILFISLNSFAQEPLVPYHSGKLWGLADTLGKIKVVPAYDTIEMPDYYKPSLYPDYGKGLYIVSRNGKYGLLKNTMIFMPLKYHRLRVDSAFIREDNHIKNNYTLGGSREIVYSLNGKPLLTDSIMEITPIPNKTNQDHLYCVSGRKNTSGVFLYDPKQQKIVQWIISGKSLVLTGDYVNGVIGATIFTDQQIGNTTKEVRQNAEITVDPATKKYVVKIIPGPQSLTNRGPRDYDAMRGFQGTKNNFFFREIKFETDGKSINEIRTDKRYLERGNKTDTLHFKLVCDSILLKKYYINNFERRPGTLPDFNTSLRDKIDSAVSFENYAVYFKDGKLGAIVETKVIPPLYNDLRYFEDYGLTKPYFLVSLDSKTDGKLKWGIVNSANKMLLPCIYDEIRKAGNYWLLKKGGLYGLSDREGNFVLPVIYDDIIPDENAFNFNMVANGKYGFFTTLSILNKSKTDYTYRNMICQPVFPYKVSTFREFNNYMVYELVDNRGRVLGYADKKGFLYFKSNK